MKIYHILEICEDCETHSCCCMCGWRAMIDRETGFIAWLTKLWEKFWSWLDGGPV